MEIDVTPEVVKDKVDITQENVPEDNVNFNNISSSTTSDKESGRHNKKVIKHALRQQAKRRRKNTTIASGNTVSVPRIIVKPLPPQPVEDVNPISSIKTPTMKEVLASIPGFSIKPRKRSNKKLSTAAQLEQTKEGCIDLETPDSILVNTTLRALLNKYTFAALPPLYQHKLVQLLPSVDRQILTNATDAVRLTSSSLNNEFFARACLEWQERLSEGEFTPENQQKLKTEADKERSRLDPWKLKHFEPIWGDRTNSETEMISRPPIRTTIKLRPSTSLSKPKPPLPSPMKRLRTVGAMTRSCTNFKIEETVESKPTQIPDLLPIRQPKVPKTEIPIQTSSAEAKPEQMLDTQNNLSSLPEISIINVSDSIINTNSETIITSGYGKEKRRRSLSSEGRSPKRKTPSPTHSQDLEIFAIQPEPPPHLLPEPENSPQMSEDIPIDQEDDTAKSENETNLISMEDDDDSEDRCYSRESEEDSQTSEVATPSEDMKNDVDDVIDTELDAEVESSLLPAVATLPSISETNSSSASSPWHQQETECENTKNDIEQIGDDLPHSKESNTVKFPEVLPNTLIIQQESISLPKEVEDYSAKVVDESELVLSQLTENNFHQEDVCTDDNEDRFIDAENYVLESGQISATEKVEEKIAPVEDIQAALFSEVNTVEDCWDVVDSSTEKLLEVPLHALDSVPVGLVGTVNTTEHVEVIPMQEELEVRLEEGTFPVPTDWPYGVKMDSDMVAAALGVNTETPAPVSDNSSQNQYIEYQGNQVKLELEVTLTPEIVSPDSLVTSTVRGSGNGSSSTVTPSISKGVTTVIPPTTIVCLPSVVSTASITNQGVLSVPHITPNVPLPRAGMVQSSSALPYLALSTSQPIRAVSTHTKVKPKSTQSGSNRNRSSNKPPPGAVNLERSYQICQAVIQNSPNRDQLRCQLKPPPSLLAANINAKKVENNRTQYGNVSSSRGNKTFTPPLPASGTYNMVTSNNGVKMKTRPAPYQQQARQPSPPVVVRHVFTSGQGIPVTMAVLPQAQALSPEVVDAQNQMGHVGQYILVQRAGVGDPHIPRSSSAPPAQQQIGAINTGGMVSIGGGGRGRPASVDIEHPAMQPSNDFLVQCPNPGTQAITRRQRVQQGIVYGDVGVGENQLQNYTIIGDNLMVDHPAALLKPKKADACPCNLKAMVMCSKCGAFCHDDCISPNKLCSTCFIR
ncbi:PREDICTED: polycomb protein Asx isoform X1 [Nicrophorus vespilloides]|uniref:Polycomb protein Asx isoform X1 n=1 Tax=Nicrophorus vespilloides TaxID=110193 RepID=A0ABM1NHD4_NICVS|nr:PREDICTED: polycomb protein Asx isoform X1 [Nicrophorus vespilloides]